jgi:hypothetical protein
MDSTDLTDVLDREPWLRAYVADDLDLDAARARYREGQRVAADSIPPRTRLVRDGLRTTSYAS